MSAWKSCIAIATILRSLYTLHNHKGTISSRWQARPVVMVTRYKADLVELSCSRRNEKGTVMATSIVVAREGGRKRANPSRLCCKTVSLGQNGFPRLTCLGAHSCGDIGDQDHIGSCDKTQHKAPPFGGCPVVVELDVAAQSGCLLEQQADEETKARSKPLGGNISKDILQERAKNNKRCADLFLVSSALVCKPCSCMVTKLHTVVASWRRDTHLGGGVEIVFVLRIRQECH